ncbi:four-carbon acid sugar kinase family protein [Aureimonas glaciei]|uniref:Type III effector Hrp-dependent outer domain-containing protein n=1 Tax=Aureimonas glaciei TaxID=1776957 RepID=A0A916XZG9_9HYPH|nr:four-carbon acid sugar kinase family protein [Aureimonas glaciei]GGD23056.1 type III effector Hrp-dependent outer domain-containing protein [Aureimonas glaciei]
MAVETGAAASATDDDRERLLLSYYGDDLTGSTDVMEALSLKGVPTVLFADIPTAAQRARFPGVRALGIAGTSRSETPAWMDAHLTPVLGWLKSEDAEFCHYKVCSTFDSSPGIGSIGRAMEIGRAIFDHAPVPILVGGPQLKRYTAFGTLFAAYRGEVFRIDRHPVMAHHPVTPMAEADLRRHLALQTSLEIGLVDCAALAIGQGDAAVDALLADLPDAIFLDVLDAATQAAAGRQLRRLGERGSRFVVGSSGVEYALAAEWAAAGRIAGTADFAPLGAVDRLVVVSGSCSPTTERQIRHAEAEGFCVLPLDPRAFLTGDSAAVDTVTVAAERELAAGRSVIIHTAMGPESDLGSALDGIDGARHAIGRGLGRLQARMVRSAGLKRVVIAGGDTSSHALRELGIFALTVRQPFPQTPGSPLTTAYSDDAAFDGIEIALKGGQVGHDDYFVRIRTP